VNRIAAFAVGNLRLAWVTFVTISLVLAVACAWLSRELLQDSRLTRLEVEAERSGVEIMSLTLNGSLMGATSLVGLIDRDVKADLKLAETRDDPKVVSLFSNITRFHNVQGIFLVQQDGMIKSGWDSSGKSNTNLNIKFRPYFQMAMKGKDNVYAAVSLARGDRALYFAAPVFESESNTSPVIGVIASRTDVVKLDSLLDNRSDIVLLLSPQGVVFASTRSDWIGTLTGQPTPDRLKAIRDLKQFGAMFEKSQPPLLPVSIDNGVMSYGGHQFAVASSPVFWNDPSGDWRVVLMEDLSKSVPLRSYIWIFVGTFFVILTLGVMALNMLRGHHAQMTAAHELSIFARKQEASAHLKSRMALAGMKFQQAPKLSDLSEAFFKEARDLLGALQGTAYTYDKNGSSTLLLMGSYACAKAAPDKLIIGQGLLGQCAAERQIKIMPNPEPDYWSIRSGLGECNPHVIVMAPIMMNDRLLGVVELALLDGITEEITDRLKELVNLLAVNIEIRHRR
jgi:C4-dicarboxylate-specific signal transduction histidine kinase